MDAAKLFSEAVDRAGGSAVVALALGVSRGYVDMLKAGTKTPGRKLSKYIWMLYRVPMDAWDVTPVVEMVPRIVGAGAR
jgi:hypothetical protein